MNTGSSSGCIHQAFHICLLPPAICTEAVNPPPHSTPTPVFPRQDALSTIPLTPSLHHETWGEKERLNCDPWQAAREKWADFSLCSPLRIMLNGVFSTCLLGWWFSAKETHLCSTLLAVLYTTGVTICSDLPLKKKTTKITNRTTLSLKLGTFFFLTTAQSVVRLHN